MTTATFFYRHKRATIIGIWLICLFILWTPVKNSALLFTEYLSLKTELGNPESAATPQESSTIDIRWFEKSDIDKETFQAISEAAHRNNVTIEKIEPATTAVNNEVSLVTKRIVLEGNYVSILKTLSDATGGFKSIKISSVAFARGEREKKEVLFANVVLQTLKP